METPLSPNQLPLLYGTTNERRLSVISNDLENKPDPHLTINEIPDWGKELEKPELSPLFRATISVDELTEEVDRQKQHDPSATTESVLGPLMVYAGVHPDDDLAKEWCRLGVEFSPSSTYPYATLEMWGRRVPMRAIPDSWQSDKQLRTPFIMRGNISGDGVNIFYNDGNEEFFVGDSVKQLPPDSLRVLAYLRQNRAEEITSITINPIQTCPIRCAFCFRGYDRINGKDGETADQVTLVNLDPEQIATHLALKFKDIDWADINQIALLSGAFPTYDKLYEYAERFIGKIREISNGRFDPLHNEHQNIHTLTHLARTREQFEQLKSIGIKTLEDTVEIVDQATRESVMPKFNPKSRTVTGKADATFEEILMAVKAGTEVYGKGYSTTLILGLDDFSTTQNALKALKAVGLESLSYPTYQPYGIKDTALYKMSFSEIMEARRQASQLFTRVV